MEGTGCSRELWMIGPRLFSCCMKHEELLERMQSRLLLLNSTDILAYHKLELDCGDQEIFLKTQVKSDTRNNDGGKKAVLLLLNHHGST